MKYKAVCCVCIVVQYCWHVCEELCVVALIVYAVDECVIIAIAKLDCCHVVRRVI